jgi:riboflavin kinase/FMN adenylyltransferase
LQHDRQPISSTRVRQALAAGDVATAGVLLGRPFTLDGDVVPGDGRGRTLGIPTANIRSSGLLPAHGVYAGWCLVRARAGESRWRAVMNIGARPTFGAGKTTVEAHLIDFSGDLYGSPVRVDLRERLRPERRFDGPDALKAQIAADIARALQLLR